MKKRFQLNNESGFTLVEIAIVMVIIGLLIGGIIKGQAMIENAKIKKVITTADSLRAAVLSYQDRFNSALPGDDLSATSRPNGAGLTNGNGDGQIAAAEAPDMFMHLAAAGLISGSYTTAASSYPHNPFGGTYFIQWATISGVASHWINDTLIPGDIAQIIDSKLDDGTWNTGTVQGSAAYTSASVTLYQRM